MENPKQEAGEVESADGAPIDFDAYPIGALTLTLPLTLTLTLTLTQP